MQIRHGVLLFAFAALPCIAATPGEVSRKARAFRVANEQAILKELVEFLAIPNLASDTPNIEKNAAAIQAMFAKRQVESRLLRVAGAPPLVIADLRAPGATKTIGFYAHYDGQPIDPAQWSSPPWQPVIRDGRVYARSASDDKAPIIAMLTALDSMRAARIAQDV
ncbi:MAG: M20/M25/M40 family metallo-hydrolase, partial [Thermoanaerobaculia bacterium]